MEKLKTSTKLSFAIGGLGKDMMFAMSTIMLFYFNTLLGISSAFLGVMMMIVRIWDAVNDPIMGTIVDNTKSRFGKFRPWILIGSILNSIILVILFINPNFVTNSVEQYVFVTVLYTLWGMSHTLMDIPFWSMIPALTSSQKERESVSVLTRLFTSIGFFIVAAGYISLAKLFGGGDTTEQKIKGLLILAIVVSIIFLLTQLLIVFNVKERIVVKSDENVTVKTMFKTLIENDQLLIMTIVILITNFTLYITIGMSAYYIIYDLKNEDLYILFMTLGGVIQVVGLLLYPVLSRLFKRKTIFNLAMLTQFIGFVLLFINAFIIGQNIPLLILFGGLVFLGQGVFMVLQTLFLSDVVEYGEYITNRRSESIAFSVQTFIVKMAMGLSLGFVGVGLAIIKFKEPIEKADGTIEQFAQSDLTLVGIRLMMFILPLFGLLISAWIFNKKHILDEEKYESIVKELEIRRG